MGKPFPARLIAEDATSPKVIVPNLDRSVSQESAAAGVRDERTPAGILPPWFFLKGNYIPNYTPRHQTQHDPERLTPGRVGK